MSKKKSRSISVNGIEYRWQFFEDSGFNRVTIQAVKSNGQKILFLEKWPPSITPSTHIYDPITPSDVEAMILFGLGNGWTPNFGSAPLYCSRNTVRGVKQLSIR